MMISGPGQSNAVNHEPDPEGAGFLSQFCMISRSLMVHPAIDTAA